MQTRHLLALISILLVAPALTSAQISPNARLLQRPEWDGALGGGYDPSVWPTSLKTELRYQDWEQARGFASISDLDITFIERISLGGRLWCISLKPEPGERATVFGDLDLWAKYQFLDDPVQLSLGALITVPSGDDDISHPQTTTKYNFELFCGTRYYVTDAFALIGHLGLRVNSNRPPLIPPEGGEEPEAPERDGRTSLQLGGGILFQVVPALNALLELNVETKRYEEAENDVEVSSGLEYSIADTCKLRGGLGFGLDDAAPDVEAILAVEFLL